jgi:CHASE3 domain sensor protein
VIRTAVLFSLTVLCIISLGAALVEINLTSDRAETSQANLIAATLVKDTLIDAESGVRGYIITDDDSYLEQYYNALDLIDNQVVVLQNPAITELVHTKLGFLAKAVEVRHKDGFQAVLAMSNSNVGKKLTDGVRTIVQGIQNAERKRASAATHMLRMLSRFMIGDTIVLFGYIAGLIMLPWSAKAVLAKPEAAK